MSRVLKLEKICYLSILMFFFFFFFFFFLISLTVEEHLWFYAKLKGAQSKYLSSEIDKMITDVGLVHKRNELSTNLSGRIYIFSF